MLQELSEAGIEANFDYTPFKNATFTNTETEMEIKSQKPFFYLVKRGPFKNSLDCGLKEQALKCGVEINFNSKARETEVDIVATGPKPGKILRAVDKGIAFSTDAADRIALAANDALAYKGYSYLLIRDGYGCLCTFVVDKTALVERCFRNTMDFFKGKFQFQIKNPHYVGGIGSYCLNNQFKKEGRMYVGEAAGIQDLLWGFGIRSAIYSGYLAAKSIIDSSDYGKAAKAKFTGYLKASIVNRYYWDKAGEKNYEPIFKRLRAAKDPHTVLLSMYNFTAAHRLLFPVAYSEIRKRYNIT